MFQLSPNLLSLLKESDFLQKEILSAKITDNFFQKLRFDSLCERICYCFVFSDLPMSRNEVAQTIKNKISPFELKKQSQAAEEIIALYFSYQAISWDYYADKKLPPVAFFLRLYARLGGKTTRSKMLSKKTRKILSISKSDVHPLISASLVYLLIHKDALFTTKSELMASIASWSTLSAFGYTVGNMVSLEKQWKEDFNGYRYALDTAIKRENATIWVEYVVQSFIKSAKEILKEINDRKQEKQMDNGLTERQRAILSLFSPRTREITNKKIRAAFKISTLTASRDLAKLLSKGLVVIHGKGRMVFYTKR